MYNDTMFIIRYVQCTYMITIIYKQFNLAADRTSRAGTRVIVSLNLRATTVNGWRRDCQASGVTLIAALNDRASICLIRHIIMPHRTEIDEISDPRFDDAIQSTYGSCPRRGVQSPSPATCHPMPSRVKSPAGSSGTD